MYDMYTVGEAAKLIGIRREGVWRHWIKPGKVKVERIRDKPYISASEIERVKAIRKEAGKC